MIPRDERGRFDGGRRNRQLRMEVLDLPEWYQPMSNSSGSCPWCENMQHWGHDPECPRKLVESILKAALS